MRKTALYYNLDLNRVVQGTLPADAPVVLPAAVVLRPNQIVVSPSPIAPPGYALPSNPPPQYMACDPPPAYVETSQYAPGSSVMLQPVVQEDRQC